MPASDISIGGVSTAIASADAILEGLMWSGHCHETDKLREAGKDLHNPHPAGKFARMKEVLEAIERHGPASGALLSLPEEERRELAEAARVMRIPAGTTLFRPGDACEHYIIVLDGVVRVFLLSETGREILLYRVESGQTCVLTTAALLTEGVHQAEGVAETDGTALAIPAARFHDLLGRLPAFRRFVFSSFAVRLHDLIGLVAEVAFARLDVRLAALLLKRCGGAGTLALTHQEIAAELGSTREAVSRLLKSFEQQGMVRLRRGAVDILDAAALARLAGEERPG